MNAASQNTQASTSSESSYSYKKPTRLAGWGRSGPSHSGRLKRNNPQPSHATKKPSKKFDPLLLIIGGSIVVGVFGIVFVASSNWDRITQTTAPKIQTVTPAYATSYSVMDEQGYEDPNIKDTWNSYSK